VNSPTYLKDISKYTEFWPIFKFLFLKLVDGIVNVSYSPAFLKFCGVQPLNIIPTIIVILEFKFFGSVIL